MSTTLYNYHIWIEASETGDSVITAFGDWFEGGAEEASSVHVVKRRYSGPGRSHPAIAASGIHPFFHIQEKNNNGKKPPVPPGQSEPIIDTFKRRWARFSQPHPDVFEGGVFRTEPLLKINFDLHFNQRRSGKTFIQGDGQETPFHGRMKRSQVPNSGLDETPHRPMLRRWVKTVKPGAFIEHFKGRAWHQPVPPSGLNETPHRPMLRRWVKTVKPGAFIEPFKGRAWWHPVPPSGEDAVPLAHMFIPPRAAKSPQPDPSVYKGHFIRGLSYRTGEITEQPDCPEIPTRPCEEDEWRKRPDECK